MGPKSFVAAALLSATIGVPAGAAITDIHLEGSGFVTYSVADPEQGLFPPAVGTPITINADFHLGTAKGGPDPDFLAAPPDNFTGHFSVDADMLFPRYSVLSWSLASTLDRPLALGGGEFDFVAGQLVYFNVYYVGDPDGHSFGSTGFSEDFGADSDFRWGGTWQVTLNSTNTVPEPSNWALMLTGFAFAGATLRRSPVRRHDFDTKRLSDLADR